MEESSRNNAEVMKHFNPRLRRSLRIYLIVGFAIMIYVILSTIKNGANPLDVLVGLVVGVVIGIFFARIFKISWDSEAEEVMYRIDAVGIILIVIFIIFDFTRGSIVANFVSGPNVGPTSFAVLAGCFYGRVFGSRRSIITILREQKVLPALSK